MKETEEAQEEKKIFLEEKQIEINKIITEFKFSKEALIFDQYNNWEIFNKIKELAASKGGFLNNNNRKILWNFLFYKKNNKKGILDLIKINKNIELFFFKLNLFSHKKELNEEKLNNISEYKIILNDLPRTCKNILINDSNNFQKANTFNKSKSSYITNSINNSINNDSNINYISNSINNSASLISQQSNFSPEIFMFTCKKMKYKYLQGLLNIIFYFKKIFNYENCINALNIYFEFFFKDFLDKELNEENNDENIALISSIISYLYNYLFANEKSDIIEEYIPVLSNKWIISDFISEIKDINKGFRILDYLIVNEPYIKYVLATVLMQKFNTLLLEKMKNSLDSSVENIFDELKKDDLNSIDFDKIIEEVEIIKNKKGEIIKKNLNEKYGKNYLYSFNLNNQGLISFYLNLFKLFEVKKPKKQVKIKLPNIKYFKYLFASISFLIVTFCIYDYIDKGRYFW